MLGEALLCDGAAGALISFTRLGGGGGGERLTLPTGAGQTGSWPGGGMSLHFTAPLDCLIDERPISAARSVEEPATGGVWTLLALFVLVEEELRTMPNWAFSRSSRFMR